MAIVVFEGQSYPMWTLLVQSRLGLLNHALAVSPDPYRSPACWASCAGGRELEQKAGGRQPRACVSNLYSQATQGGCVCVCLFMGAEAVLERLGRPCYTFQCYCSYKLCVAMCSPSSIFWMEDLSLRGSLLSKPVLTWNLAPTTTNLISFPCRTHNIQNADFSLEVQFVCFSNAQISAALHKHANQRDPDP